MNPTLFLFLIFALFLGPMKVAHRISAGRHSRGYWAASAEALPVLEARAFIQSQLAHLQITEVLKASTRVEAGLDVRLICRVLRPEQAVSVWEFMAHRRLGGQWDFRSGRRL